tara:strand:- start:90 stop:404 length:315 start_codon:yes stop_codon:yes gene_type:complete
VYLEDLEGDLDTRDVVEQVMQVVILHQRELMVVHLVVAVMLDQAEAEAVVVEPSDLVEALDLALVVEGLEGLEVLWHLYLDLVNLFMEQIVQHSLVVAVGVVIM